MALPAAAARLCRIAVTRSRYAGTKVALFTKPAIYARVVAFVVDYVKNNCETKSIYLLIKSIVLGIVSRETLILVKVVVLETVLRETL